MLLPGFLTTQIGASVPQDGHPEVDLIDQENQSEEVIEFDALCFLAAQTSASVLHGGQPGCV